MRIRSPAAPWPGDLWRAPSDNLRNSAMYMPMGLITAIFLTTSRWASAELSAEEIRYEIIDRELAFYYAPTGREGLGRFAPDGTAFGWNSNLVSKTDIGKWRLVGNHLCVQWQITRGGEEACFTFLRAGPGMYCTSHRVAVTANVGSARPEFPNCTSLVS